MGRRAGFPKKFIGRKTSSSSRLARMTKAADGDPSTGRPFYEWVPTWMHGWKLRVRSLGRPRSKASRPQARRLAGTGRMAEADLSGTPAGRQHQRFRNGHCTAGGCVRRSYARAPDRLAREDHACGSRGQAARGGAQSTMTTTPVGSPRTSTVRSAARSM